MGAFRNATVEKIEDAILERVRQLDGYRNFTSEICEALEGVARMVIEEANTPKPVVDCHRCGVSGGHEPFCHYSDGTITPLSDEVVQEMARYEHSTIPF